jgi:hypothetical protein
MRRSRWTLSLGCLLLACGDKAAESTSADETTVVMTTAMESAESTSAGSDPAPTTGPASTSTPDPEGSSFIVEQDGGVSGQCDPKIQDCPDGEKCTAVSDAPGEPWGINICVPVMGEGQPGDPCDIMDGKYTGLDNCGVGLICLLTDDEGQGGACVEFCDAGSACPLTDANCVVYNEGSLPICLGTCDPLIQDCPEGQACYSSAGAQFVCFKESVTGDEGMPGDECQYVNQCQEGTFCANAMVVANCPAASNGCCTPWCPVSGGAEPCQDTEDCVPFFEAGMAPPGQEDVGVCAIPG